MNERIIPSGEIIPKVCSFRVMTKGGIGACIKPDTETDKDYSFLKCDDAKRAPAKCPLNRERAEKEPLTISKPKDCPFRSIVACNNPERPMSDEFIIMKCSDDKTFPRLCPLEKAGEKEE